MKAILEFNLPEDTDEFTLATKGKSYYLCLWELSGMIRAKLKHGELSDEEDEIYSELSEYFYNILENNNVSMDDVE